VLAQWNLQRLHHLRLLQELLPEWREMQRLPVRGYFKKLRVARRFA
jgi:hypothetical protein